MQALIGSHPGLQWKALNVRRILGGSGAAGTEDGKLDG